MCRKSIFVSFMNERLGMKVHGPRYTYREEILRWAWWLHIILVVVWGWNVVVDGRQDFWHSRSWENQNPESPDNATPPSWAERPSNAD